MKPLLRGHFHQAMFFIMLGAGIPLLLLSNSKIELVSVSIYVTCALMMFGISTLYHRINWTPEKRYFLKKLDHSGIYLMIAGTFTPICVLGLSEASATKLLITIWTTAVIGITQSLIFVNLPKYVSAIIYLIAGYLVLPYLSELKLSLGNNGVILIIVGGILYTIGAVCYGMKRPVLNPKIFSYHEVFHIFVNLGAATHLFLIYCLIN
jgi:hemolysin III